jgi:ferritin
MKHVPAFQNFEKVNEEDMNTLSTGVDVTSEQLTPADVCMPIMPNVLPDMVESILNERLGDEYTAYYTYRNAANWCKDMNYAKAAAFFNKEADNELQHAQGIQDYLTQWNLLPQIPAVPTTTNFTCLVDIINQAYKLEFNLLQKYSANAQSVFGMHQATYNFLQKYVDYQNDEVAEYADLLNALQLINPANKFEVLYFENKYLK